MDGLSVNPVGVALNTPPVLPVIFAIGFASKVEQNELLGYVKFALSLALTCKRKVSGLPTQDPTNGVTTIVPEIFVPLVIVPVPIKLGIFPFQFEPNPMELFEFDQLNMVPEFPAKFIALKLEPSQTI